MRTYVPGSFESNKTTVRSLVSTDVTDFRQALEARDYVRAAKVYTGPFLKGHSLGWGVELEEWLFEQRERVAEEAQEALLRLAEEGRAANVRKRLSKTPVPLFAWPSPKQKCCFRFHSLFEGQDNSLAREVQDLARGYGVSLQSAPNVKKGQQPRTTSHNLPHKGTSFVGRDIELAEVVYWLLQENCRLLSLVGVGGVGKSRLALQAAYELLDKKVHDGIYYIKLDALTSPTLIFTSIADEISLNLSNRESELDQFIHFIAEKNLLLILDNFEHLIEGATQLSHLLQSCSNLKLLVTFA